VNVPALNASYVPVTAADRFDVIAGSQLRLDPLHRPAAASHRPPAAKFFLMVTSTFALDCPSVRTRR